MLNQLPLKTWYGKHYAILRRSDAPTNSMLQAEPLGDQHAILHFLADLQVSSEYWQQLACRCSGYQSWRNSHIHLPIEAFIAMALSQGELQCYPVSDSKKRELTATKQRIKGERDTTYQLLPASAQFTDTLREIKRFSNQAEARQFLQASNPSEQQLQALAEELNLPAQNSRGSSLIEPICQALVDGKAIVSVERTVSAPPKPIMEAVADTPSEPAPSAEPPPVAEVAAPITQADLAKLADLQAAALISAAEQGSPVCEECE